MKMWSMEVIILLLFGYAHAVTWKAKFVSENFNNVLHWDPVESALPEEKVLYSVQYKSDDMEQFQMKKECQNITTLLCDLTAETASFYDLHYEARVFVNGSCIYKTPRFKPIAETIFGPPTLYIKTTVSSLLVDVILPVGPNGVSIGDIINRSTNGHSKGVVKYILEITEPEEAAQVNEFITSQFVINLKNNKPKYCGHVVYNTASEHGRPDSQKASFCVTLPGDYIILPWILISVALVAVMVIMLVACMCNYAKGGKLNNMPQLLVTTFPAQPNILRSLDKGLNIIKAEVCTDRTHHVTIPVKPKVPSTGNEGYSPQHIIFQAYSGSSVGTDEQSPTPDTQDTSAQTSDSYSVVVVHKNEDMKIEQPNIDDKTSDVSLTCGETWNECPTMVQLQNMDAAESNSAKPLMLHTVRNPNGQLMLSSLIFQLQSSTSDEVSCLASERKPLLSDLINTTEGPSLASLQTFDSSEWSDSGCDESTINTPTIYSPSQTAFHQGCLNTPSCDAIGQSGYKQNWMTGILGSAGTN